jgi:hypothetical protein
MRSELANIASHQIAGAVDADIHLRSELTDRTTSTIVIQIGPPGLTSYGRKCRSALVACPLVAELALNLQARQGQYLILGAQASS